MVVAQRRGDDLRRSSRCSGRRARQAAARVATPPPRERPRAAGAQPTSETTTPRSRKSEETATAWSSRPPGFSRRSSTNPCAPCRSSVAQLATEHDRRADAEAVSCTSPQRCPHTTAAVQCTKVCGSTARRTRRSSRWPPRVSARRTVVPRGPRMRASAWDMLGIRCRARPRCARSCRRRGSPARWAGPCRSATTSRPRCDGSTLRPMPEYVDAVSWRTSLYSGGSRYAVYGSSSAEISSRRVALEQASPGGPVVVGVERLPHLVDELVERVPRRRAGCPPTSGSPAKGPARATRQTQGGPSMRTAPHTCPNGRAVRAGTQPGGNAGW